MFDRPSTFRRFACAYSCSFVRSRDLPERELPELPERELPELRVVAFAPRVDERVPPELLERELPELLEREPPELRVVAFAPQVDERELLERELPELRVVAFAPPVDERLLELLDRFGELLERDFALPDVVLDVFPVERDACVERDRLEPRDCVPFERDRPPVRDFAPSPCASLRWPSPPSFSLSSSLLSSFFATPAAAVVARPTATPVATFFFRLPSS
jgi:hypothetical protein